MKLGELINTLAKFSGIPEDDGQLKSFLSNTSVIDYDVPVEMAQKLQSLTNLISKESAKNNPEIKGHYFSQAYDGLDRELSGLMNELELPEELKNKLIAEKSSTKRATLLAKEVRELEKSKSSAGKEDKNEIQRQINELNAAILTEKENTQKTVNDLTGKYEGKIKDLHLTNILAAYNYATPISKEANIGLAKSILTNEITTKELQIVNGENGLSLKTKDGMDYFVNNQKLETKDFVEGVLASHKLLATAPPATPPANPPSTGGQTPPTNKFAARAAELASQNNA